MPIMTDSQSVAANSTVANVVAGKPHEFIGRPSIVRVYATSSATGINLTLLVGGVSIVQDQLISAANRFPIRPDDLLAEAAAAPGSRLVVSLRNSTGGALTVQSMVEVTPVA